jgi:putative ATPase
VVAQQYAPDGVDGKQFYRPTDRGNERDLAARLSRLREILRRR